MVVVVVEEEEAERPPSWMPSAPRDGGEEA